MGVAVGVPQLVCYGIQEQVTACREVGRERKIEEYTDNRWYSSDRQSLSLSLPHTPHPATAPTNPPTHHLPPLTSTHPRCPSQPQGVGRCPCVPCVRWCWWRECSPCCGCMRSPASPRRAQERSSVTHCTGCLAHWTPVGNAELEM